MVGQSLNNQLSKQTSRHIGKILSLLESIGTDKTIISQIRKEIWFLHDDILELVNKEEGTNEGSG